MPGPRGAGDAWTMETAGVIWLLDTNVVSESWKPQPNPACALWLERYDPDCCLSVITICELRWGIELLPESKRKREHQKNFNFLMEDYGGRCLDFDGPAAFEWGRYAGELELGYGSVWFKQFQARDTIIGAIAREYGLTVATRKPSHFPFCQVVDPFDSK